MFILVTIALILIVFLVPVFQHLALRFKYRHIPGHSQLLVPIFTQFLPSWMYSGIRLCHASPIFFSTNKIGNFADVMGSEARELYQKYGKVFKIIIGTNVIVFVEYVATKIRFLKKVMSNLVKKFSQKENNFYQKA